MSRHDEVIGAAVARLRGERSQQWLADEMRKLGWKWAQATVWNVEKGERPLRLAEAADLAEVLGAASYQGANAFLASDNEIDLAARMSAVAGAEAALKEAVRAFLKAREELAIAADLVIEAGEQDSIPRLLWTGIEDWLDNDVTGPEELVRREVLRSRLETTDEELGEEMIDRDVTSIHDLASSRDAEAKSEGHESYAAMLESKVTRTMPYSGMKEYAGKRDRGDNGEHQEEA